MTSMPPSAIRVYIFKEGECGDKTSDTRIYTCVVRFLEAEGSDADTRFLSGVRPAIARAFGKKPRFDPGVGLYFSVSHSRAFWVCAVSGQEVGIDLQKKADKFNHGIVKRFFHPDERRYLEDNGFGDFFMIWAAKESYVKFTGLGIDDGFSAFSSVRDGRIGPCINDAEIRFLPFDPEYVLCLCAREIGETPNIEFA
ncbi:MAG: 4'-phosphopantetheinyl transferase superfamily protein [Firmicutes bacterium]|nr:4'-phosphopantetheinyl transferase superfamily protein [Bacillota bacterium]